MAALLTPFLTSKTRTVTVHVPVSALSDTKKVIPRMMLSKMLLSLPWEKEVVMLYSVILSLLFEPIAMSRKLLEKLSPGISHVVDGPL